MSGLKSLAKDTAIYGISSIVGRFLNYLLVPIYTISLPASTGGYGIITNMYAITALLLVLLTCGMETGFFRFANKGEDDPVRVYSTTLMTVGGISLSFLFICLVFLKPIAGLMGYEDHPWYLGMMLIVIAMDAIQSIPFAYLRYKKRPIKFAALILTGVMAATTLFGCGSSSGGAASDSSAADSSSKKVLKVGMECAYAPFNWTQDTDTTPDGSKAVKIAGSDYYAYGYDVAVAQKLADQMGMDLEVHKVEWSSIGISLDAGDYDCIIAGMGKTKEREASYAFTEPYYYRNNCVVVKKGGKYSTVKGLSDLADTGCKVTTQLGTGWIPLLDQIKGAEQSGNFETTSECFLAISNGSADVCVIDVPTAESAALTNDDLQIIELDENDTFTGDDEMVNVCIATRKDDTALRDKIQDAMNAIGWNDKAKMDELMDQVLTQQPAAN